MWLLAGLARAQDPEPAAPPEEVVWTGRMVALRTLVAPDGGLPDEDLEPLLQVRQDRPYDPQEVRQDIQLLQRVADFEQVEVDVEEWVAMDAAGNPIPAVRVEYRVYPPPQIDRVLVDGNRGLSDRAVRAAGGRDRGDAWFDEDTQGLRDRVEAAYRAAGWLEARVDVVAEPAETPGHLVLHVRVDEGRPRVVRDVAVSSGAALGALHTRWILARNGVRRGRPLPDADLERAREAVESAARKAGWYEARVTATAEPAPGGANVAVLVDPGRRWDLVRSGGDLPSRRAVEDGLLLREGVRLTRTWAEDASATLTEGARGEGYLEAAIQAAVTTDPEHVTVVLSGTRGPRHRLRRVRFEGVDGETDRVWSARYMRDAFREASDDVLDRRGVTPGGVDRALASLTEFYRAQGYLSVRLVRTGFSEVHRRPRVVPVDVEVVVTPGPRAYLDAVRVVGGVPEVDGDVFFADLVDRPLNPAELDARSRRLVEALAERGYLSADARVRTEVSADGKHGSSVVDVTPGPVVYLRSLLVKGYGRTRRQVIEREIDLVTGDALSPSRLAGIRRRLYDIGVFSRVEVTPVGDEDRVKDVVIQVEERKNLYAEVGGGLATDQGARLFLRSGHRNLWGLAHRFTVFGQAGVGWIGDQWTFDWLQPEWRAAMRYEAPSVPTRGESLAVDVLLNEEQQEPSFRLARSGLGVGLLLRVGDRGHAEIAYRFQARRLLDVDPGLLVAGDPWLPYLGVEDVADPRPATPTDTRFQSGLSVSLFFDLRDDTFNPTEGGIGSFSFDIADRFVSATSFVRTEAAWTQYVPVGALTLLVRGRGGAAVVPDGKSSLPVEDRFRLGGGASFRGFELDSVGPANEVSLERVDMPDALDPILDYADRDAPSRWVPTGGDAMGVGTLEVQVPLPVLGLSGWEGTNLAFFSDVGNVWYLSPLVETDSMAAGTDPLLRWSVGLGIRRSTAVGPVAIDVGFDPMFDRDRGETLARVHFSVGAL